MIAGLLSRCGGRYRTRTDDLFRVKEARSQLRQSPIPCGYVNRYYPTLGGSDDQKSRHARDSVLVLTTAERRLMFIKCSGQQPGNNADVAQLVAHNLAKVGVASSSLVIRSSAEAFFGRPSARGVNPHGGVAERLGTGLQSRLHGFESRRHLAQTE